MLDYIRSNAQSFGVKIAFGVIILVFVFWGVGSLQSSSGSGVVAMVNDQPIIATEVAQGIRLAEENIRRNVPQITREQLQQMQIGQQVLQQIIVETVIQQEARRLSLEVTPHELLREISKMPVFRNEQGRFDPEVYKRVLAAQRQQPAQFEDRIRKSLVEEKIREDVTDGAYVSPEEARAFFNFAQESRTVEYLFFPAGEQKIEAPAEDAVKAWYESNRQTFAVPPMVDVEYLLVRPQALVSPDSVSEADARAYYDAHEKDFTRPDRVKVRHILLRVDPAAGEEAAAKVQQEADTLLKNITGGGDFAALAKERSADTQSAVKGGDLGWVERGVTVPPFEKAAFALKAGEVSAPVRTDFGWHIIKVDAREDAGLRPFEQVLGDIRTLLAERRGADKMHEAVDALVEANILGKPLAEAGKPYGITSQDSGMLHAQDLQKKLGLKPADMQTMMKTSAGSPVDTALEGADNSVVIARVKAAQSEKIKPYDEVKAQIVNILAEQDGIKAALKAAADVRATLDKDGTKALPEAEQAKVKRMEKVMRGAPLEIAGTQPELLDALFTAKVGQWLPTAYEAEVGGAKGSVLVRVTTVETPKDEEWKDMAQMVQASMDAQRKNMMYQAFVGILLNNARIEIMNPGLLQDLEKTVF